MPKPAITRVSSMVVDPNYNDLNLASNEGFYAPQLTTAQIALIAAPTLKNGALVYNTTTNTFQVYQSGAWTNLSTGAVNALVAPAVAATGALPAAPANGMIVYQTDIGLFKIYQAPPGGAGWSVLYANVSAATGVGLVAGNSPYSLPSGTSAAVEVAGNQVNGFAYYNTTATNIRAYVNGAWDTVIVADTTGPDGTLGNATLIGGAVTVVTSAVATGAHIFLQTRGTIGTANAGNVRVSTINNGVSFVISSTDGADTSVVDWFIVKA